MSSASESYMLEVDVDTIVTLIVDEAVTVLSFGDPERGGETQYAGDEIDTLMEWLQRVLNAQGVE